MKERPLLHQENAVVHKSMNNIFSRSGSQCILTLCRSVNLWKRYRSTVKVIAPGQDLTTYIDK